MSKKKETLLEKIVHRDYNNELEKVIETKDFDEDVKNLLLGIFYKIDISYKDYKKVKRNVENKQEYVERIIKIIEKDCNKIITVKPNSKKAEELGNRTFLVDTKNKKIICYPVERKLLYSISKIGKQDKIIKSKYIIVNQTISNMINIGNNINTVEPLRDFNGWSWLIIKKEIENISYNLIYQNLRILVGEPFLNSWIANKEYIIDYYDELKNVLSEKFGNEISERIIKILEKISILLEIEINPKYEKKLYELAVENNQKLEKMRDNKAFVEQLTEEKKQITKKIRKIERVLSSKQLLEKEYTNINKSSDLSKKIFSIKILEEQKKKEKQDLIEELDSKNKLMNPKNFIKEKVKLEKIKELLEVIETKDKLKEREKALEEFQKIFLQCLLIFINIAETKEEILNLIYLFRYYNLLPFNEKIDIYQNKNLQKHLKEVKEELLKKAIQYKVISTLSENIAENIELLQFIFQTKIISIEDIYISIIKEKDKCYVEFSENSENTYEEKYEINLIKNQKLNIKLKKKIKIIE